ncbi:hypothetical protein DL239_19005 [Sedimentitalea sp. CY04]|uniref:Adenylate cyclase n=2 Tax=Parasedimentitalea denitrificans TaxID=2211118 RepID=A0ABX0WBM9_9RHOB|nr:hypothetical protein [Sedimentitalea sp. CY04]
MFKKILIPLKQQKWLPVITVATVGVCISLVFFLFAIKSERQRLLSEFREYANQPITEINNLVLANISSVESMIAFYESSDYVSRQEFNTFASSVLSSHDSIQALEWLPKVVEDNRKAFALEAQLDGFSNYRITERAEDGKLVLAGSRPDYFPVYYVEPLWGNEEALGFDVQSETTRFVALLHARRTGQIAASEPISLVQSTNRENGVLIAAPVFEKAEFHENSSSTDKPVLGFVLAVFQIPKLIMAAENRWVEDPNLGDFYVFSNPDSQGQKLIFAHQSTTDNLPKTVAAIPKPYVSGNIQIADRRWQMIITPPNGWPAAVDLWLPWSLLFFCLGLTVIASAIFRMRLLGVMELEGLSNALQAKNEKLEAVSKALAKYLPSQLWDSVLADEGQRSIGAKRKQLTVFFGDIVEFTRLTHELPPDQLMYILNDFFTEMSAIGIRHGATLDKYVGDAVVMFFGDPTSNGARQDAASCVKMAIEMQERMIDLRKKWLDLGYPKPFHMRVGIHSGSCSVGNFGSDERMSYTIVGEDVNLAARVEKLGKPDKVTITSDTLELIRDQFEFTSCGVVHVESINRDIELFSINLQ